MKEKRNIFSILLDDRHRARTISYTMVAVAYIILEVMLKSGNLSSLFTGLLVPATCYLVAAIGLNLNVGVSGELNLGQAGFMAVGAFSGVCVSGILKGAVPAVPRLILAIIVGMLLTAFVGFLIGIPVLKLQGDYLAIVTLAFGEIIRNVMNCIYVSVDGRALNIDFLNPNLPGKLLLNGPNGAVSVGKIATFTAGFILVLVALFVVLNLTNSRSGRAIMAIRDARIAAESVGINATKYKMMAFVISAVLAGMAGALYGLNYSTLVAGKFKFDQSINVLVFVVLGGIGNTLGSVIAAAALTILPELLREFSNYRMLVYAIVLILVMLVTNNPTMRAVISKLVPKRRGASAEGKGGAAA